MSCDTMRIVQRQREREEDEIRKKKREDAKKRKIAKAKADKLRKEESKRIIKLRAEKFGWIVKDKSPWSMTLMKPRSQDLIEVDIMEDDMIKLNVPGVISGPNHANADNFLIDVTKALGAKVIQMVRNTRRGMAHAAMHAMGIPHDHS